MLVVFNVNSQNTHVNVDRCLKFEFSGFGNKLIPPNVFFVENGFDTIVIDAVYFFEISKNEFDELKNIIYTDSLLSLKYKRLYFTAKISDSVLISYKFCDNKRDVELLFRRILSCLKNNEHIFLIKNTFDETVKELR